MLTGLFKFISLLISRIAVFLDTSHKLFPGRLAYKHELNGLDHGIGHSRPPKAITECVRKI